MIDVKKVISLLLVFCMLLPFAGCKPAEEKEYDAPALVQSILSQVQFADTLTDVGTSAAMYFQDLPEGTTVQLYIGDGYYPDEVALITVTDTAHKKAAKTSVDKHLEQIRNQFANYNPEELDKIDDALVWEQGKFIIVCITDAIDDVKTILDHADDPNFKLPNSGVTSDPTTEPTTQPTTAPTTQPTTAPTTQPTTVPPTTAAPTTPPTNPPQPTVPPTTPPTTVPPVTQSPVVQYRPDGYPAIMSQSGTYSAYSGTSMIRVDNSAFEVCGRHEDAMTNYAALINRVADALAGTTKVYSLAVPTAFGVKLPDDIQAKYPGYADQGQLIEFVLSKMSANVIPARCYDNIMSHRNEYVYFHTDHHWNGIGAYYAYEAFCEAKGIQPYTMEQREELKFGNFLGTLYQNSGSDQNLLPADTIYAYKPVSKNATMVYYDRNGNATSWPIIANVETWGSGSKYSCFAAGDNPLTVFTNPDVTDGSVCIVVKESYGNALMPYLVDHYSTVYEVDYRHWKGDIVAYAREVGADDLIFANNIMMINTSYLVGVLNTIIK